MIKDKTIKIIFFLTTGILLVLLASFSLVSAAETPYVMLEKLPGMSGASTNFSDYFSALYKLSMSLALVLAMFQLSKGGFEYLTTDAFAKKTDAKEIIKNALFGLLLILISFLLLKMINPDLINVQLKIPPVNVNQITDGTGGS